MSYKSAQRDDNSLIFHARRMNIYENSAKSEYSAFRDSETYGNTQDHSKLNECIIPVSLHWLALCLPADLRFHFNAIFDEVRCIQNRVHCVDLCRCTGSFIPFNSRSEATRISVGTVERTFRITLWPS